MKYFEVKASKDNHNVYFNGIRQLTLIGSELFTEREMKMYHIPFDCVNPVQVKKTNTYISFGGRFEMNGLQGEE
jgi:hypothetical protein